VPEFVVRRVARLEIQDAANWYEDRVAGLGARFIAEVDGCIDSIRATPAKYPIVHRDIRRALLKRFPYAVYFVLREDSLIVVGCTHTRRDPKRWQRRH